MAAAGAGRREPVGRSDARSYRDTVRDIGPDAEQLELAYQRAARAGEADAFGEAVEAQYAAAPENLLYAAWHYRLAYAAATVRRRVVAWGWAIPLAIVNGLFLWFLSDARFTIYIGDTAAGTGGPEIPAAVLLAAPVSALAVLAFLALAGGRGWLRAGLAGVAAVACAAYVLLAYPHVGPRAFREQYVTLMLPHLALVAWAAVGAYVLARRRDAGNVFAFLIKSIEVVVLAGLFALAGGLFTGITFGLFSALGLEPPEAVVRLFVFGGAGLIVVLAVAMLYDPLAPPREQGADAGLGRLIASLLRLMLPAAVLVGLVYLAFIPFHARQPFENREVLIVYNAMLFAVLALLVGATPLTEADLGARARAWLRWGIVALAALALVVSAYALAAILYRTAIDRLTPNRLAIIGWNLINIAILAGLLIQQLRGGRARWLPALHRTFAAGTVPYAAWTLCVVLALPWLFRFDPRPLAALPAAIRDIASVQPYPLLLKCPASPHIYLLEAGAKRWVKDIPTFTAQGYRWDDVHIVSCPNLAAVPDGRPIPPDAGPPPAPLGLTPVSLRSTPPAPTLGERAGGEGQVRRQPRMASSVGHGSSPRSA